MLSLGGENTVGFGADFDGVDDLPQGICGVQSMEDVVNELLKKNYSQQLIDKILFENIDKTLKLILKN